MNSIDILYKYLHEHKIFARIVCKQVTPNIKSRRAKLDEKLKKFGGNLIIASTSEYPEII
jgi:predicted secreted acid phosphatase